MIFTPTELDRYARHILLREIGGPGQQKLNAATVTVIGAGGLGSPVLLYLAAAGVGTLRVIDDDTVSLSNLQRQVLHTTERVGMPKTDSAVIGLAAVNPHIKVEPKPTRMTAANAASLLADTDVIVDGSDSFETRSQANETASKLSTPLVSGAIGQWEGQLSLFDVVGGTPCYACIFPNPPAPGQAPSCAEAGVVGALPGIIGAMMAAEVIKHITGAGQTLRGEMLIYDALWGETRKIRLKRRADCPVCGGD